MRCRRCAAEWTERTRICPICGYRRVRARAVATIVAAAVLLAGVLTTLVICLFGWLANRLSPPNDPPFSSDAQSVSTTTVSNTVWVTIPEGRTVLEIADLMEQNNVCSAQEFIDAVQNGDFSSYDFVSSIPLVDENGEDNGRVFRLEGYLYPDTYEFYKNCGGEAAVKRFLDNFARRWQAVEILQSESGIDMTVDEVVTLASIIQWEAGRTEDMPRMSRVLWNRLESVDYPRLQCDVTTRYLRALEAAGVAAREEAYSTYVCRDLPVGAINNPGVPAMLAAVAPSDEELCKDAYFFLTDSENDMVYYARTYAEHLENYNKYLRNSSSE